jgi:outer membrane exchange protein TraA
VTVPTATAAALQGQGQGLCVINVISTNPALDFPNGPAAQGIFNNGINAFLDTNKPNWNQYVQRTIFDLSNNQDTGPKISWGDFLDSMMSCQTGGCDFAWNDTTTSFASRFRGFLNVTPELAGIPVHIGFYADDAVSLTFYDKSHNAFPVMTQPPVLGSPTWRLTETVTFMETGLYPLEILYAQITEHAALEMSFFTGTFTDFDLPANQVPITSLNSAGFTLFPVTRFFQTLSGEQSYPDINACKQCDRQFVGQFGNNGCDAGYYCNEAALCAPCDTAIFCGPTCAPCGGMTPFCVNINSQLACGECRTDGDCPKGLSCDPVTHVCNACNVDADCAVHGQECVQHKCEWCSAPEKCAGNSCNCCPKGSNGKQMMCAVLPNDAAAAGVDGGDPALGPPPECVECLTDLDCASSSSGPRCDSLTGQCVASLANNESPDCCGPNCLKCENPSGTCIVDGQVCDPQNPGSQCCSGRCVTRQLLVPGPLQPVPMQESKCEPLLCLPGPYGTACAECRNDLECSDGNFCIQGTCSACNTDRHCGARCETCGADTPFCQSAASAADAKCVRCNQDSDCVGGHCDATTHDCVAPSAGASPAPAPLSCMMTCTTGTYCDGQDCVECYADTQCPCGNTCDLASHSCSPSCKTNADCQGDQHCHHNTNDPTGQIRVCSPGALPNNADCGGTLADLCGGSIGARGTRPTPSTGVLAVSLVALLLRRLRRRGLGGGAGGVRGAGGAPIVDRESRR